jgi:hypothetical protein
MTSTPQVFFTMLVPCDSSSQLRYFWMASVRVPVKTMTEQRLAPYIMSNSTIYPISLAVSSEAEPIIEAM